jgi:hypothetical protein
MIRFILYSIGVQIGWILVALVIMTVSMWLMVFGIAAGAWLLALL